MFNAYEILNLNPMFNLNPQELEKAYLCRIGQVHPDRHCTQAEAQRKKSLEDTAKINEAYRILKDPLLRAQHFLRLQDDRISCDSSVSPQILAESMELREALEEAGDSEKIGQLLQETHQRANLLWVDLQRAFEAGDSLKGHALVMHLTYLRKFSQESQEKLWLIEDGVGL